MSTLRQTLADLVDRTALGLDDAQRARTVARMYKTIALMPQSQRRMHSITSDAAREERRAGYFERRESTLRRRDVRQIRDRLIRLARSVDRSVMPNPTAAEITTYFTNVERRWGTETALQIAKEKLAGAKRRGWLIL